MKSAKCIKEECEWKYKYDEKAKESRAKIWENEHDVCEKVEIIKMVNECEHSLKKQHFSMNCTGTLWVFS